MDKAEFDKFAEEYTRIHKENIELSGESPEFFSEYKIKDVRDMLGTGFTANGMVLDFGAGVGGSLPYFKKYFPDSSICCLDVSEKSLEIASSRFPGQADFRVFEGLDLPFSENTFDLVFAACVFHHIPPSEHERLLGEWFRVLKPGGIAVIFEHNPLNPLTVHAVNTCPFDENAELISGSQMKKRMFMAGFNRVWLRYRLFFPHFLRGLRFLERWLEWCPLGAQYMVYSAKPGSERA